MQITIDNIISFLGVLEAATAGVFIYYNARINKLENTLVQVKGDVIRLETQQESAFEFGQEIKKDLKEIRATLAARNEVLISIQEKLNQLIK